MNQTTLSDSSSVTSTVSCLLWSSLASCRIHILQEFCQYKVKHSPLYTIITTGGFWREHKRYGRLSSKCRLLPSAPLVFCVGVYRDLSGHSHQTAASQWAAQQILGHPRQHGHSTWLTTQGHDFPKTFK